MLWRLTWKRNGKLIDSAEMRADSILEVLGLPQVSENKRVLRQQATEFQVEPALPSQESATVTPLFGTKTHPMKPETRDLLRTLLKGPQPAQVFNPGVLNRWQRGGYIEYVQLPSLFVSNRGTRIPHVEITMLGRAQLRPDNYSELASSDQWEIDKHLGLLDWDGR